MGLSGISLAPPAIRGEDVIYAHCLLIAFLGVGSSKVKSPISAD